MRFLEFWLAYMNILSILINFACLTFFLKLVCVSYHLFHPSPVSLSYHLSSMLIIFNFQNTMSVTKQPKQEKFLRETKPLIRHQLPFERQFNKGYPEEPVIPKFDISFAEFNMRLRNIGPDQQQPIDDKAKRVIMNEIEKIPEMYSGRNTYLQKRHYGTVAHNTFKRTGVFYTRGSFRKLLEIQNSCQLRKWLQW